MLNLCLAMALLDIPFAFDSTKQSHVMITMDIYLQSLQHTHKMVIIIKHSIDIMFYVKVET